MNCQQNDTKICSSVSLGYINSRVEEEYLWECKQLGALSPLVLLNTLLFFGAKMLNLKTVEQQRRLTFANVTQCSKTTKNGASSYLRFKLSNKEEATDKRGEIHFVRISQLKRHASVLTFDVYQLVKGNGRRRRWTSSSWRCPRTRRTLCAVLLDSTSSISRNGEGKHIILYIFEWHYGPLGLKMYCKLINKFRGH